MGRRLSDYALGPKISHFVREMKWAPFNPPVNRTEKWFVELSTAFLSYFHLELGHFVTSLITWGIVGFLSSDSYAVPWLFGTSEDSGSQDEGWFVYVGGRIAVVVCIGTYRLYSTLWNILKMRTALWISRRETTIIPIEQAALPFGAGQVLQTPYGNVKVISYNAAQNVVETEFTDWKGRDGRPFKMYQTVES